MAKGPTQDQSLYGLPDPLTRAQFPPVVSRRSPLPSDTGFSLGQLWINNILGSAWILVQVQQGQATWQPVLGGGAGVQTINGFLSIASNFNFMNLGGLSIGGAAGIFSAGVNVDGVVTQIIANQVTVQRTSASGLTNPLLNGVGHFDSSMFSVDANGFVQLAGGGLSADEFTVNAFTAPGTNPVLPSGTGNVSILASSVAAVGIPAQTNSTAANTLTVEVQRASAQVASLAANAGLASFDSASFVVDLNGFVSLAGGGIAIDQIAVDAFTGPGTNPVDPTVAGLVTITGGQVASGTTANVIRSHSTAANSLTIEVQRATTAAVSTIALNGVSHFDSASFAVNASGYVQMANGLPASAFDVQANTAPGTDPVVPNALGVVAVSGAQVAAVAIPIQTNSIAANSYEIQVQRSSAQLVSTLSANGICHFSSAQFSVDANGFVQSLASVAFVWQDFAPGALAITNGYFATGAGAYTLPLGTLDGQTIEIIDNIGGGVVVTAAGAQTIRVQNVNSSAGGTCTSTLFGDGLRLIFRASIGEWQCNTGAGGNWILA